MSKKTYKALMVEDSTHYKIVLEAKRLKLTVDEYLNKIHGNKKKNK